MGKEKLSDGRINFPLWIGLDNEEREHLIGAGTSLMIRTKEWKYIEPNNFLQEFIYLCLQSKE
ncbi:hypothetical protein SDC9_147219 [bioreactor metagenome]|uniref:Uncharacterized protein n=1 Tax=bioreactor metagenome TaxID=1076179 RepID=A0A645EDB0_9ZZZZ|nr:hypothetical protein [Petrimonas sp.]MEA5063946.1 hypothetical protein [Petrimonas sp.]OJV35701.1 MAG: hypothetical protein BGO33_10575 [Bacteroidia bacterium 43-41]